MLFVQGTAVHVPFSVQFMVGDAEDGELWERYSV